MGKNLIVDKYNAYRAENDGLEPNVAYVMIRPIYSDKPEKTTIVLDVSNLDMDAAEIGGKRVVPFIDDVDVYWYCNEGILELLQLADENCLKETGADFVIEDLIEFDTLN
jgi:hypothetical protein